MVDPVRNQRLPTELKESDVDAALARIEQRDAARARDGAHVYETLTWGEGPGALTQHGVQDWLWYRLPTKYLTDEPVYMGRMAEIAAELFDELELDWYAAICRSETTAEVHRAFDRSDETGLTAMSKAMDESGIRPPDLDDFQWGQIMGIEESNARSAVELVLEQAIADGELVVGARAWRARQRNVTRRALDADHPVQPGQSWRSAVTTERLSTWTNAGSMRSEALGRLRARVANRLLHPVEPPLDLADRLRPLTWYLDRFGPEQPLTQAGYLNTAFVAQLHTEQPWDDKFSHGSPPRSETDARDLHGLRLRLETIGALRKYSKVVKRTARGTEMVDHPLIAWTAFTSEIASSAWDRFAIETCGLVLVDVGGSAAVRDVTSAVARVAGEMGWGTSTYEGEQDEPSHFDVSLAVDDTMALLELFGLLDVSDDGRQRRWTLTPAGTTLVLTLLREDGVGPRNQPW
ncbi:MAG: hypothetical protein ABI239_11040 [Aquihabitans sp.]